MVCDIRPFKEDKHIPRLTVGGDTLDYIGDASSLAAPLVETKLLLNSVNSEATCGSRFLTLVLKVFLQSYLPTAEYMKICGIIFLRIYIKNITLTR